MLHTWTFKNVYQSLSKLYIFIHHCSLLYNASVCSHKKRVFSHNLWSFLWPDATPTTTYNKNHCLVSDCHIVERHVQSFLEWSASLLGVCHKMDNTKVTAHAQKRRWDDFVLCTDKAKCVSSLSVKCPSSIGFNPPGKTRATSSMPLASCQNKPSATRRLNYVDRLKTFLSHINGSPHLIPKRK